MIIPSHQFLRADRPDPGVPASGAAVAVEGTDGRPVDRWALSLIEELDDTIFEALAGDAPALDRAAELWRQVRLSAPEPLIEESREQYVRRALAIADEYTVQPAETLGRRFAALEVLALMAE